MNKTILFAITGILLALVSGIMVLHPLQTQGEGNTEWIIWFSDSSPPIGKPVIVKVWAYNSEKLRTYNVSCNITIVTESDVVLQDNFTGDPAVYNFTFWKPNTYTVELYCKADTGENGTAKTNTEKEIEFRYPTITATPTQPEWGRPFTLTFEAEYPYNTTGTAIVGGREYSIEMVNGLAKIDNLVIYDATDVFLNILNGSTRYQLTPTEPNIIVSASPPTTEVNNPITLTAWFSDENGIIPTSTHIKYILTGACGNHTWDVPAGTPIQIVPTEPGTCTFKAEYSNSLYTVSNKTTITINKPTIVNHELDVNKIDDWDYKVYAYASTSTILNGTLTLYIDDNVIGVDSGFKNEWSLGYVLRNVTPGVHTIKAVFDGSYGLHSEDSEKIIVPRHKYTIPYSDKYVIPFGVNITNYLSRFFTSDYRIYVTYVNKTHIEAFIYYPGNWYYLPAYKRVIVKIVYPEINISEDNINHKIYLSIKNGYPGANVTVYCVKNGTKEVLYQTTLRGSTLEVTLPDFDCGYVYAKYMYLSGELIVKDNKPEPVLYITTCPAGVPCTPVAPSKFIERVYIGGHVYNPGEKIVLKEGSYLVRILETDGTEIDYTLTVTGVPGVITVYYNPSNPAMIYIPSTSVPIMIVLNDGRVLTITHGTNGWIRLPDKIVYAYSPWAKVKLVPLYIIRG
jgi:hypothetical protein